MRALTTLPRAHDLDVVAGIERRRRPRRARNDGAVERHRDAALGGVGGLFREQRFEGFWRGEWFALAVDADFCMRHRVLSPTRPPAPAENVRDRTAGSRAPRYCRG